MPDGTKKTQFRELLDRLDAIHDSFEESRDRLDAAVEYDPAMGKGQWRTRPDKKIRKKKN